MAIANFGKFPYGKKIKGRIFYNKNFDGCLEDSTGIEIKNSHEEVSIILVKRYNTFKK
jgi:hypothetical protein